MVCPLEDYDNSPYFTAFTLSKPVNSRILIRVMNPSASSIQLHAGQKVAEFIPVVESATVTPRTSADNLCVSISNQSDYCQSVKKALVHSNHLAQRNLAAARSKQALHYDNRSKRDWTPYEPEQTVWLWHPKHWKSGKKVPGLTKY